MSPAPAPDLGSLLAAGASAVRVFAALAPLSVARQGAAVAALTPEQRRLLPGRLAGLHSSRFGDERKALLRVMFDHTPDQEPETLARLLGVRFHLRIRAVRNPRDGALERWDGHALRHLWRVLEALPPADVEDNERLDELIRYAVEPGSQAAGAYGRVAAAIGYDPATLDQPDRDFSARTDPLYEVNAFNETVRHEVGHAVDQRLSATAQHAAESAWGGWRAFGADVASVARAMIESAAGPIHGWRNRAERERLVAWVARRLDQRDGAHLARALRELDFLDPAERARVKADPVLPALRACFVDDQPWLRSDGGLALGGRIYQESYRNLWFSYDQAARARKVSLYQFRAPGEWFAEAYAAYYEPPSPGVRERGAKLKERDPHTWAWIRDHIDRG